MEENKISSGPVIKKYAMITSLAAIAFFLIMDLTGQSGNQPLQYVWYVVLAALIFFAHKEFKEEGDGYMNYGKGLGIGTLISLIYSVVYSVFFFVYVSFVNKEYMSKMLDLQREKMEEGGMSGDQLENAMEMTERFMSPGMMVAFAIFFGVLFGFIVSLIISAITQNKRPENQIV